MSAPPEAPPVADGLVLGEIAGDEDGHFAEVTVEAGSPWFDGHFPDRPVLPAVAHVEIAYRLHRAAGERGYLAGIDAMRFSEPVVPGDRLVARLTACDEEGRGRFRLARGGGAGGGAEGEEVSSGTFWWGSPSADEVPDPLEPESPPEPVAAALPHGGPARLVDRVAVLGDSQVVGEGGVPAAHAAAHEGKGPIVLAVELAAQAAAQVPRARGEGEAAGVEAATATGGEAGAAPGGEADAPPTPRLGYLVRLRDVRFARTDIEVGAPLLAHVDLAGRTGPLARFDFVVTLASGEPLASGSLATWELAGGEG